MGKRKSSANESGLLHGGEAQLRMSKQSALKGIALGSLRPVLRWLLLALILRSSSNASDMQDSHPNPAWVQQLTPLFSNITWVPSTNSSSINNSGLWEWRAKSTHRFGCQASQYEMHQVSFYHLHLDFEMQVSRWMLHWISSTQESNVSSKYPGQ